MDNSFINHNEVCVLKGQFNLAQRQRLEIHKHVVRSGLKAQVNLTQKVF
jgi:hypothetical protein